jgi:hypothetical protein
MSGEGTSSRVREKTNANKRLSKFLLALNNYNFDTQEVLLDVERKVLQLSPGSGTWMDFETTAAVANLLTSAKREVELNLSTQVEFYTRSLAPLATTLGVRQSMAVWKLHKINLREAQLVDVEHAAQRLKELVPELELFEDELSPVLVEIDELLLEIDKADLSPAARSRLVAKVQDLRLAIQEYKVGGSPVIRIALEAMVGTLVLDEPVRNEVVRTANSGSGLWQKVKKVIGAVVLLLGTANTIHDGNKNFLQPLEHILSLPSHEQVAPPERAPPSIPLYMQAEGRKFRDESDEVTLPPKDGKS